MLHAPLVWIVLLCAASAEDGEPYEGSECRPREHQCELQPSCQQYQLIVLLKLMEFVGAS